MSPEQRKISKYLRGLSSFEAAEWLLEKYNRETNEKYGEVFAVLPHRSWKRQDQIKLADHYLSHLPHATGRVYKIFLSFMSVPVFIDIIKRNLPEKDGYDLLIYYLEPILWKHAKTDKDRKLVDEFIHELKSRCPSCD